MADPQRGEDIRSLSKERFLSRWGEVSNTTMSIVEACLRDLLGL